MLRSETVGWATVGRKAARNIHIRISRTGGASLYSVLDVIEVCPVAFEIYERLKKEYVWEIQTLK